MPRENPPTRLVAAPARPVISMTSRRREVLMSWVAAIVRRCDWALRPGCTALASSRAPTSRTEEPGHGAGRYGEAEGVHGGLVAVTLNELVCLDYDRNLPGYSVGLADLIPRPGVPGVAGRSGESRRCRACGRRR